MPEVRRTRATFRSAEFGFFGVVVYTRVQTPRRCGAPLRAGVLVLSIFDSRPLRTNCWMVGKPDLWEGNLGADAGRRDNDRAPHGRPTMVRTRSDFGKRLNARPTLSATDADPYRPRHAEPPTTTAASRRG